MSAQTESNLPPLEMQFPSSGGTTNEKEDETWIVSPDLSPTDKSLFLPPSMRTQTFTNLRISGSGNYLPGKSDEDRITVLSDLYNSNIHAFGVFDGHGGSFGSSLCSQRFCNDVIERINSYSASVEAKSSMKIDRDTDIYDAIVCASIRKVTEIMDHGIKLHSKSGTTATTLFLQQLPDGSHNAYCANTGDSRCILALNELIVTMSEDHKLSSKAELKRLKDHEPAYWIPLPLECVLPNTNNNSFNVRSPVYTRSHRIVSQLFMPNESLIEPSVTLESFVEPAVPKYTKVQPSNERLRYAQDLIKLITIDNSNHPNLSESKPLNLNSVLLKMKQLSRQKSSPNATAHNSMASSAVFQFPPNLSSSQIQLQQQSQLVQMFVPSFDTSFDDDSDLITLPMRYNQSFVTVRSYGPFHSEQGELVYKEGPEAVFSRHGVSMTMTRSIGDKHAARSCVRTPDIVKCRIPVHTFARFIVASDGLWDVMSNERCVSLIQAIDSTQEASSKLVTHARNIREGHGLRIDDVSCIVVDVNVDAKRNASSSSESQISARTAQCCIS